MKSKVFAFLAAGCLATGTLLLTGCPAPKPDTLTAVLKDLPPASYSLNFQDLKKDDVLTQSTYGTLSTEVLADIDEICPSLKDLGYKKFPRIIVWPPIIRTFIPPPVFIKTCPTMIPYKNKDAILEAIKKSNWAFAQDIVAVKSGDYAILGSKDVFQSFASIKADSMDMLGMKGVNIDKVFLMPNLGESTGIFKRSWYGEASLDDAGLTFSRFPQIFPPKQIGCFDPEYLKLVLANLSKINPAVFNTLKVKEVAGVKGSVLTF